MLKIISFLLLFTVTGCFAEKGSPAAAGGDQNEASSGIKADSKGMSLATVVIKTVHGNIAFKFYPTKAPNTSKRIAELVKSGFYDGLTFHRVVPNFVIQGGDPKGDGTGGTGMKLKAEFNDLQHVRGTVAMARSQDPDSADSQFYIALNTLPNLDRNYTIFGQVIEGLELLDKVVIGEKIISMTYVEETLSEE